MRTISSASLLRQRRSKMDCNLDGVFEGQWEGELFSLKICIQRVSHSFACSQAPYASSFQVRYRAH